ncbi:MAG: hypothetical protein QM715_04970 [Nibricoccus sp.]
MTLTKKHLFRRLSLAPAAFVLATSAWAQVAPVTPATEPIRPKSEVAEKKIPVETVPAASEPPPEGEVLVLSPFEVITSNKGYYSANSMSGTRMNSKIEDLGQSITVMTKEQMNDFAMRDINDVFDYMASTEGTNTYSQFTTDRTGAVVDNVSLNPNTANRVRGIGSANIAFNNIAMTGRVPVDPLWMEALELSRGPNANIFGLGNASGTVNQVPATANLNRNFTKIEMRADSYEGWSGSIDVNRMLVRNKLSVRASYKNEHIGFVRKPAEENARRISFQVKAQPFKNTTLAASYFGYKHNAVRPNYTTPRDHYTDWLKAGKPGWNPVTRLITFDDGRVYGNGNVLGSTTPYGGTPTTNTLLFLPSWGREGRSPFLIGAPGETSYWLNAGYTSNPTTPPGNNYSVTDPYAAGVTGIGILALNSSDTYTSTQQPLYNSIARPISDKSIYDWTKINLAGNSKAWDDVDIYMVQLDQIILNTPTQTLAFQGTFLREDSKRLENQPMGPASVNSNVGQLQVDVNRVFLDGTPNPYYGRPYLRSSEPYLRDLPKIWDTGRVQFAYRIDFSKDEGWSKWLGTHQVVGYYEYKDQQNWQYTYRHVALGTDKAWEQKYYNANNLLTVNSQSNVAPQYGFAPNNNSRLNEQYYVGSTPGGGIEYAPNYFPEGTVLPYVWGPSSTQMFYDVSPIGFAPAPGSGGGLSNVNTRVKTTGGVIQSSFLEGKLVATYGLRRDNVSDRNSALAMLTPDLRDYNKAKSNNWTHDWREAEGKTKSLSIVARPFRDIGFLKRTAERGSGARKFLAEAATSFSPTYNKSDNFIAQGPAYDLFLHRLPNQSGITKDVGFWVTVLDGALTIHYTKFDTKQFNLRDGDIGTMAQRLLRNEGFVADDAWNLRKQVTNWLNNVGSGGSLTDANAQIAATINMPVEQYNGLQTIAAAQTYAAVNDMRSTGQELEVFYNPTKNWTVSASVTKTQSINTAVGSAVDDYIAARMPIWTTLEDPRFSLVSFIPATATTTGSAIYSHTLPGTPTSPFTMTIPIGGSPIPNGPGGHLLWWKIVGTPFQQLAGYNNNNSAETNFLSQVDAPMSVFRSQIGRPRPQIREYSGKFSTKYNLAGLTENKIIRNITVGGSWRYTSKGFLGYYGLGYTDGMDLTLPANKILQLDGNRPIYSKAETYIDLFVSYNTKMFHDKVRAKLQLNVKNVGEKGGGLQPTAAFFDGRIATYRIVDPRQFVLTASFDL